MTNRQSLEVNKPGERVWQDHWEKCLITVTTHFPSLLTVTDYLQDAMPSIRQYGLLQHKNSHTLRITYASSKLSLLPVHLA